jgi:molybdopterin/thiamine biosynthesis adenylyltransferase
MDSRKVASLSDEELEFYSRQIVLPHIGYDGQQMLRQARVCVAGVGGLGSVAATQLAAMGAGHLRLVDYDVVELSNLQRQHLYDVGKIGYPKVEVAASRLRRLNPFVDVEPLPLAIRAHNADEIIRGSDVVVDGLDRLAPRHALNRACVKLGIPYVFGAAVSMYGNTSTILPEQTPCLQCFQGSVQDDALPSCSVLGVHPSILSLIASIQVSEAVRVLLHQEPRLAGKLLHCDLESLEFEVVEPARADDCPACGRRPLPSAAAPERIQVTELCSRQGRRTLAILPPRDLTLDMDQVVELVESIGLSIEVRGRLGTTFFWGPAKQASLLSSGIMIVEGVRDDQEARDLYRSLVDEGLGSPL